MTPLKAGKGPRRETPPTGDTGKGRFTGDLEGGGEADATLSLDTSTLALKADCTRGGSSSAEKLTLLLLFISAFDGESRPWPASAELVRRSPLAPFVLPLIEGEREGDSLSPSSDSDPSKLAFDP